MCLPLPVNISYSVVELGVVASVGVFLQYFDAVGWATGGTSSL